MKHRGEPFLWPDEQGVGHVLHPGSRYPMNLDVAVGEVLARPGYALCHAQLLRDDQNKTATSLCWHCTQAFDATGDIKREGGLLVGEPPPLPAHLKNELL